MNPIEVQVPGFRCSKCKAVFTGSCALDNAEACCVCTSCGEVVGKKRIAGEQGNLCLLCYWRRESKRLEARMHEAVEESARGLGALKSAEASRQKKEEMNAEAQKAKRT